MSNFKNVLKVYTMMRAFDADDNALLNTLRNATEAELESLAEAIGPVKRTTAKRTRKSSKSPRAASLAGAIGGTVAGKAHLFCVAKNVVGGGVCNMLEDNAIHDKTAGYAGYHPFQSAVAQAAAGGE